MLPRLFLIIGLIGLVQLSFAQNGHNSYFPVKSSVRNLNMNASSLSMPFITEGFDTQTQSKGSDTLYISNAASDPKVIIFDQHNAYAGFMMITWISPNFGYILLDHTMQYDFIVIWTDLNLLKHSIVALEDVNFLNGDTIHFSEQDAQHEITVNSLDYQGLSLYGYQRPELNITRELGEGHFVMNQFFWEDGHCYISDFSSEYFISVYALCPVSEDEAYWIEYPGRYGINQSLTFENDPGAYITTNFSLFTPNPTSLDCSAGFLKGIFYKDRRNNLSAYVGGYSPFVSPRDSWTGTLHIINEEYEMVRTFICPNLANNDNECMTAGIEYIDGSIIPLFALEPPFNAFRFSEGDTLPFGKSPITLMSIWQNNSPIKSIRTIMRRHGQMWDFFNAFNEPFPHYEIYEESGSLVWSGDFLEFDYHFDHDGLYNVVISNDNALFYDGGTMEINASFNTELEDATPPAIDPIQLRDINERPVYWVESGDSLVLMFNAADHNDIAYDTTGYGCTFVYQSIVADSTRVFVKEHADIQWTEIETSLIFEDSVYGQYYRTDLSEYTYYDSTALDIMIRIVDQVGNTSENKFLPAVLVGGTPPVHINESPGQVDQLSIEMYPNPAVSELNIKYDLSGQDFERILIYDLNGNAVDEIVLTEGSGTILHNTESYVTGVYVLVFQSDTERSEGFKFIKR